MTSVNFGGPRVIAAAGLALAAACAPPARNAPPMPAAPAAGAVPAMVDVGWREDLGRGMVEPLAVAGSVLVAVTTDRSILTLSAETGERYWRQRVKGPVLGPPLRDGDRIYSAPGRRDGRVYALEAERGRRIWERRIGAAVAAPTRAGDTLYVATSLGLAALRTADGSSIFERRTTGSPTAGAVVHRDEVWVATTADTLFALARGSGAVQRRVPLPASAAATPLHIEDALFVPTHDGQLVEIDTRAGRVVRVAELGAPVLASPVRGADGAVYALTRAAEVWRIPIAGADPVRIATLGGAASGSLAVAGERLVIGKLNGSVVALTLDGRILWSRDLGDSVVAPVAVGADAVFVPLLRGTLVKLQ